MSPSSDDKAGPGNELRAGQFTIRSLLVLMTILAVVCGFAVGHGSGVVFVVGWNIIATLIALAVGRPKRKAAAASLFSLFAGWCVAFVLMMAWKYQGDQPHYMTDFDFWFICPAVFAFLGWAVFALPTIRLARADGALYRPLSAAIAGASLATIAYGVLVCTWVPEMWQIAWFPAVLGGVAGVLFPFLAKSRCPAYLLFSGPSIVLLAFWCLLWPFLECVTPHFTYTYGTLDARARSLHRIIQSIKVGDSMMDLKRRYPAVFSSSFSGIAGNGSTEQYEYHFNVRIDGAKELVDSVSSEFREHRQ